MDVPIPMIRLPDRFDTFHDVQCAWKRLVAEKHACFTSTSKPWFSTSHSRLKQ
jgi:hypothetical protein